MQEEKAPQQKKRPPTDPSQRFRDYGRFAGMAFQMGATIALGVWGGSELDKKFPLGKFPVFTLSLSLLSVFAAMYYVIKEVGKK